MISLGSNKPFRNANPSPRILLAHFSKIYFMKGLTSTNSVCRYLERLTMFKISQQKLFSPMIGYILVWIK